MNIPKDFDFTRTKHEPSDNCISFHCYIHGLDEGVDEPMYIACDECGHVYRTARALRKAYREASRRAQKHFPVPLLPHLWRLATVRASRISFCQYCNSEF